MPIISYFFKQLFCSTFLLRKERKTHQDFFPTLHHEESPEKPQYNMTTAPFCLAPPPFSSKHFRPPLPFPSILKSRTLPPPLLYERGWGGFELCPYDASMTLNVGRIDM